MNCCEDCDVNIKVLEDQITQLIERCEKADQSRDEYMAIISGLTERKDYAEQKMLEADALAAKQVNRADDLQDDLDRMKDRAELAESRVRGIYAERETLKAKVKFEQDQRSVDRQEMRTANHVLAQERDELRVALRASNEALDFAEQNWKSTIQERDTLKAEVGRQKGKAKLGWEVSKLKHSQLVDAQAQVERLQSALGALQNSSELQAGALPPCGEISYHAALAWYQAICKDVLRTVNKALDTQQETETKCAECEKLGDFICDTFADEPEILKGLKKEGATNTIIRHVEILTKAVISKNPIDDYVKAAIKQSQDTQPPKPCSNPECHDGKIDVQDRYTDGSYARSYTEQPCPECQPKPKGQANE